jgi:PKD repeat protein
MAVLTRARRASRRRLSAAIAILALLGSALFGYVLHSDAATAGTTSVPRPDHVVIVVEENHSKLNIIGSPDAPYINSLATDNANFVNSYAETHPSQPNYIAMFSGATQGVVDDNCPQTFSGENLGHELLAANLGFVGYSETLPSVGYTGCTSGKYARKHNPWSDFSNVPASASQPFSTFPSDYSTLPEVSYVVPNLDDDMHDGSIAQGDAWLQAKLSGYVSWAKTHNSLFILTFDEDDYGSNNQIPTIMAGARVTPGTYTETINHYSVLRTIQDAYGLAPIAGSVSASPILDIWTPPSGDQPPTAVFTSTCTQLSCAFDGRSSTDADGSIQSYNWTFGDGASGTGAQPTHAYAGAGTYAVTLTVGDDGGATAAVTNAVTVTAPGGTPFASDQFARTVANGLGTADVGGVWRLTGTTSLFSVASGVASLKLNAGTTLAAILPPTSTDTDFAFNVSSDRIATGGGLYLTSTGRRVGTNNEYRLRFQLTTGAKISTYLSRTVAGAETALTTAVNLPNLTYVPGQVLTARFQVVGTNPTTLRSKIWVAGTTEPVAWQATVTDATAALQAAGSVGVTAYLSSAATNAPATVSLSALSARQTAAAPPLNQPPTAAFNFSCPQLTCSFDASGSSDAEGPVASYVWVFGDSSSGSGVSASHAYGSAASFSVTLTVTDSGGLSSSVTHSVTTTSPPVNQPPVAAFTSSCTNLVCSFDASSSSDAEGAVASYVWVFGDSASGSGVSASHTYGSAASFSVTLTVTDSGGLTSSVTQPVTTTNPPLTNLATDLFNRTVSNGLGTADVGGAWTLTGSAANFSVVGGSASLRLPTAGTTLVNTLASVSSAKTDLVTTVTADKAMTGNGIYFSLAGRKVGSNNEYRADVRLALGGSVNLHLARVVGGTETSLTAQANVPGVSFAPGTKISMRIQVTGTNPTTVRARVWLATATEPTTWGATITDSTAVLQSAGAISLTTYLSGSSTNAPVVVGVSNLSATQLP